MQYWWQMITDICIYLYITEYITIFNILLFLYMKDSRRRYIFFICYIYIQNLSLFWYKGKLFNVDLYQYQIITYIRNPFGKNTK